VGGTSQHLDRRVPYDDEQAALQSKGLIHICAFMQTSYSYSRIFKLFIRRRCLSADFSGIGVICACMRLYGNSD